ncbi:hypothetical protein PsorP6_017672 [Peronosclerospora sorghi]|uniref:Uncharacterized protein n=1 Tax=Peronosclerospora sorghi TaxID=230839 RepID=A0ACC0WLJ4_9STRA|nr:hypothetical protein PsorP6_017672 [Peronosclerospora sorghi]
MATLPVGMQLVSALDDTELQTFSPIGDAPSEHVRRALFLPLESEDAVEMDIDVDVFRPSAMLEATAFGINLEELYYGSTFQPDLGHAEEDIEQMLSCESEDGSLQSHHQHETAPGQGCQCRTFAIRADRVQAQRERMTASIAAKDQTRVLRHTFGSGKRLQGFGFEKQATRGPTQGQDSKIVDVKVIPARDAASASSTVKNEDSTTENTTEVAKVMIPKSFLSVKEETTAPQRMLHKSLSLESDQKISSPLHRNRSVSTSSSPLSTVSFVSLESTITTPLSTTSRSTLHADMPMRRRSLSPADGLEKMATTNSKSVMPKMSMLRGTFQVSPGQDSVQFVRPTAVLPPRYFRGALGSPHKRRAHSKTIHSFTQSMSFSFSNS